MGVNTWVGCGSLLGMGTDAPTSAGRGDARRDAADARELGSLVGARQTGVPISCASAELVSDPSGERSAQLGDASFERDAHDEVAQFVGEHRRALLRVALGMCREPAAAEDLVQDTAVRLLVHWDKVRTARVPFAYARTVLVRLYLDQVRGREAAVVTSGGREPVAPDEYAHVESVDAAVSMVAGLPPRARAVLTLRYIEDLDDREIARVLGMSRSTVRVTAHQALRRLSVADPRRS